VEGGVDAGGAFVVAVFVMAGRFAFVVALVPAVAVLKGARTAVAANANTPIEKTLPERTDCGDITRDSPNTFTNTLGRPKLSSQGDL
jgi:hypothetical protein